MSEISIEAIPSWREINAINAGPMGSSEYHNNLHEVWSAVRTAAEGLASEPSPTSRYARAARTCKETRIQDALEWAQILAEHEPSRQGSTEMHIFRDHAMEALHGDRPELFEVAWEAS